MLRKKEGFEGQRAIMIPRKILHTHCDNNPLLKNLYITDIGYYPKAKGHLMERSHGSEQHILIYCMEGKGWAEIRKEKYELTSGSFVIIPAKVRHSYGSEEKNGWTIYWVHFSGAAANEIVNMMMQQNSTLMGSVSMNEKRQRLFEEIYTNLERGYGLENLSYSNLCLGHYLSTFIFNERYTQVDLKDKEDIINRSIDYMQKNIDATVELQDLAAIVNLSPSHYSFVFRKKTGFSPIEYFNHLKVQKACQYLLFTDLRVKEIAGKIGIYDPYYFSRMFSKIMGISPNEYRIKRHT
ncbi:AraC family transcriptional regulator [Chitinophagaceae bacterium 26-R-25]|nr:AraC family transcriptional regulator [Chitinophagaceae bacterium 26-R-25]